VRTSKISIPLSPLKNLWHQCYRKQWKNMVTISMQMSPFWEPDSHSAGQKIPAFYGTRRLITVFARAHCWSLSWASWSHSTPSHLTSQRPILILSSHLRLGLPSGLFSSDFLLCLWVRVKCCALSCRASLNKRDTTLYGSQGNKMAVLYIR